MKIWKIILLILGIFWGLLNGLRYSTEFIFLLGSLFGGFLIALLIVFVVSKSKHQKIFL